jgi:hypothetical protein
MLELYLHRPLPFDLCYRIQLHCIVVQFCINEAKLTLLMPGCLGIIFLAHMLKSVRCCMRGLTVCDCKTEEHNMVSLHVLL